MDLNEKEQHTYETIGKVVNGTMTRKEAMVELHKSRQQIYNLIKVYKSEGKDGFVHKMYNKRYLEIYHLLWVLCYILIEL